MNLQPDVLAECLLIPVRRAELWAPAMARAMTCADISTPARAAHWLGQIGHETGRLRYVREIWGPTRQQLRYEPGTPLAARLGNVRRGDGVRYMGRGLIQVTGRANYAGLTGRLRKSIGESVPDFEAAPRLLESPEWAALSAADYWRSRSLNRFADAADIVMLTKRINGGTNGLADRVALTDRALSILGA